MKRYSLIGLLTVLVAVTVWGSIIEVPEAPARMTAVVVVDGGGAPPAGAAFTDDFSTDPASRWTKLTGAGWTYDSTDDNVDIPGDDIYTYNTATNTVSQYCAFKAVNLATENVIPGCYMRQVAQDSTATKAYLVRAGMNVFGLYYCAGATCTQVGSDIFTSIGSGDSMGVEVTGTGASTKWKIWVFDSQAPPSHASWGTCSYGLYITGETATTCSSSNTAVTGLGANYADSGKYVGLYSGWITATADDFMGGDI